MSEQWTLLAPVPQWVVPARWRGCNLDPGFRVAPMSPQVRRVLLNAAKEKEPSDEMLSVLTSAETIVLSSVPTTIPSGTDGFSAGLVHQFVADGVTRRLAECVRLFAGPSETVPEGFWHSPWFLLEGKPAKVCLERAKCLHPSWTPDVVPPWDLADPVEVAEALGKVRQQWSRLSRLCRIDALVGLDTDPKRLRGYTRAGNANVKRNAEELAKARLAETQQEARPVVTINARQSAIWFVEGVRNAYRRAVDRIEAKEHGRGARLARAFEFFQDSFRLQMPHSYVSLAISLESLLSLGNEGVTSQLASRIGWLLEPHDSKARMMWFDLVKTSYDLRSRIVHGGAYKTDELDIWNTVLLAVTRKVLIKIISADALFRTFLDAAPEDCDALLKRLALGCESC